MGGWEMGSNDTSKLVDPTVEPATTTTAMTNNDDDEQRR